MTVRRRHISQGRLDSPRSKSARQNRWNRLPSAAKWFLILLLVTGINAGWTGYYLSQPVSFQEKASALQGKPVAVDWNAVRNGLLETFRANQIPESWINGLSDIGGDSVGNHVFSIRVKYPLHFLKDRLTNDLFCTLHGLGWTVSRAEASLKHPDEEFEFQRGNGNHLIIQLVRYPKLEWHDRKIAVIIDDFGYKTNPVLREFLKLPAPVTWAIIPGLPHTKDVAVVAQKHGVPVIIHLPMEPLRARIEHGGFTIFTGMKKGEIRQIISQALAQIPIAEGVNNHMGSRLTTYQPTLILLMQVLREKHLFFIDSMTNPKSIAYKIARNQGVASLKMFTYLDNPKSSLNLDQKLAEAVAEADKKGQAIVIGHAREETAKLLASELTYWKYRGIYFVPVRELIHEYSEKKLYQNKVANRL